MALAAETKNVVAGFEYTDEDVNRGVQEFLRQMGRSRPPVGRVLADRLASGGPGEARHELEPDPDLRHSRS